MGQTKSRSQILEEFNYKYRKLYGKDLHGNTTPHIKAKDTRVTQRIHSSEPELIEEKVKQINETMVFTNEETTNIFSKLIRLINQLITLPTRLILWPFKVINKLWNKSDSSTKLVNKTIVKKVESAHKRSYLGSYSK